jgi:hypothetical protein
MPIYPQTFEGIQKLTQKLLCQWTHSEEEANKTCRCLIPMPIYPQTFEGIQKLTQKLLCERTGTARVQLRDIMQMAVMFTHRNGRNK